MSQVTSLDLQLVCDRAGSNDALDDTVGFSAVSTVKLHRASEPGVQRALSEPHGLTLGQTSRSSGSLKSLSHLIGRFDGRRTVLTNQRAGISHPSLCFVAPDQPTPRPMTSSHNHLDTIGSNHDDDDHDDLSFRLSVHDTASIGRPRMFEPSVNNLWNDIGHPASFDCVLR